MKLACTGVSAWPVPGDPHHDSLSASTFSSPASGTNTGAGWVVEGSPEIEFNLAERAEAGGRGGLQAIWWTERRRLQI